MTLYTSDTKTDRLICGYLLSSLGCALFAAVYERFSHEVYSYYMLYAFLFPLAGGVLPIAVTRGYFPRYAFCCTAGYSCGIATLTAGSLVCGILEIYGTSNSLTRWYWLLGGCLCLFGFRIKRRTGGGEQ